ncbi:hypothetical protein F5X68DRAFT_145873 [Plectosphaerella plurivora]|uniref:Uncharacterized protein n=1 Tax=Plectosphaerella plurivora TaxID=936078 RepID=A0A9P8UTD4_9PEZI|nr:hypothetical protein F5X68DRAFT_145873 [Plectosphaerella plurivora]
MFFTRVRRVGLLSIAALLLGGFVLIFTGINGLIGPAATNSNRQPLDNLVRVFRYGYQLRVQVWIAVLGIGFGLLSYGFSGTYIHLFDWWCSRRSQRGDGLDYGMYLNSQPQAPVFYGLRGFTGFLTIRYLLVVASVATSVGYKFAIVDAELGLEGTLNVPLGLLGDLWLEEPSFFIDKRDRTDGFNRAFWYQDGDSYQPPESAIMTGLLECRGVLKEVKYGTLYTREIVIVANMTDVEGDDEPIQLNGKSDWHHTQTSGSGWSGNGADVAVQYGSYRVGEFDVRWTKIDWSNANVDINSTLPVLRHLRYKMHLAVAEVARGVEEGDCSLVQDIQLLSNNIIKPWVGGTKIMRDRLWAWADSMIISWAESTRTAIGSIIRVGMPGYLHFLSRSSTNFTLRILPPGDYPFGPERLSTSRRFFSSSSSYPIFDGYGWTATGSWIPAACIFVLIGSFSVLVAMLRVYVGPPILTSWMGQHVYLAETGKIQFSFPRDELASGFTAASNGLGVLKLQKESKSPPRPS